MIKAQRQAARMLATRSRRVARPWFFPASSSRRGAPPALIRTKTRQTGESSEASVEFSRFLQTTSHFVHECAGLAGLHFEGPALKRNGRRTLRRCVAPRSKSDYPPLPTHPPRISPFPPPPH